MNRSKMENFLQSLNADEASQVLKTLLENDPELIKKAYDIAMKAVGKLDADTIMDEVYYELNALDVDDLYSHSGKTRYGYVDPYDRAWEMFEDALSPFIDEMKKNQQRAYPLQPNLIALALSKVFGDLRKTQTLISKTG